MGFNSGFKGLNGLVRFAERRNLVSARVPSRFKRGLLVASCCKDGNTVPLSTVGREVVDSGATQAEQLRAHGWLLRPVFKMRDVRI
jgi:hypothetical protein